MVGLWPGGPASGFLSLLAARKQGSAALAPSGPSSSPESPSSSAGLAALSLLLLPQELYL